MEIWKAPQPIGVYQDLAICWLEHIRGCISQFSTLEVPTQIEDTVGTRISLLCLMLRVLSCFMTVDSNGFQMVVNQRTNFSETQLETAVVQSCATFTSKFFLRGSQYSPHSSGRRGMNRNCAHARLLGSGAFAITVLGCRLGLPSFSLLRSMTSCVARFAFSSATRTA